MSYERNKQQSTQEELTVSGSSSGFPRFVGFVECQSNFVLSYRCFVVVSEGGLRAIWPVLFSDAVDVLGVNSGGVDLSLLDEAAELGFVILAPLFGAFLWWHAGL